MSIEYFTENFPELIALIFSHCTPTDKFLAQLTCHSWRRIIITDRTLCYKKCVEADIVRDAAIKNYMSILQWGKSYNFSWNDRDFDDVMRYASYDTLQFLCENYGLMKSPTIIKVSEITSLPTFIWLFEIKRFCYGHHTDIDIVKYNRMDIVDWLFETRKIIIARSFYDCVAELNNISMFEKLQPHWSKHDWVIGVIMNKGNFEMLKMMSEQVAIYSSTGYLPCNLKMIRWLADVHGYNFNWVDYNLVPAIEAGNLELIEWLYEKVHLTGTECDVAARNGKLEILEWLIAHGYSLWPSTYYAAVNSNYDNTDILKCLDNTGCRRPASNKLISDAAANGHINMLKYLYDHWWSRCDNSLRGINPFSSTEIESLPVIKYLYSKGYPLTKKTMKSAILHGTLHTVKWLWKHNCPTDYKKLIETCKSHGGNMWKWLRNHRPHFTELIIGFPELTSIIFSYCDKPTKYVAQFVCRGWRSIIHSGSGTSGGSRYDICEYSSRHNFMSLLKWSISMNFYIGTSNICNAVRNNSVEMLEFLHDTLPNHDYIRGLAIMDTAAKLGNLDMMKILKSKGFEWGICTPGLILKSNQPIDVLISAVKWFMENDYPYIQNIFDMVAFSGKIELIYIFSPCPEILHKAAMGGHIHVLEEFHKQIGLFSGLYKSAAMFDCVEVMDWLWSKECLPEEPVDDIVREAIMNGYPKVIEWSMNHGYVLSEKNIQSIGYCKYLDLIKWGIERNYLSVEKDISYRFSHLVYHACAYGDIEMLKWLLSHTTLSLQYAITAEDLRIAVRHNQFDLMKWIYSQGYIFYKDDVTIFAARYSSFKIIKWIEKIGYEYNNLALGLMSLNIPIISTEVDMLKVIRWIKLRYKGWDYLTDIKKLVVDPPYNVERWLILESRKNVSSDT